MKIKQPVTVEYIESGNWFLFGVTSNNTIINTVVASLVEIIDAPLSLSPKDKRDNQVFYFKTADISTFKKCNQIALPRGVIEVQIDKGIYRMIEFDNENEEAKFHLLNN